MAKHLKELRQVVDVQKKFSLKTGDMFRLAIWLSDTHPEIFKEFVAVNDVYNKAHERDDDEPVMES
jgi:hypothetical protein